MSDAWWAYPGGETGEKNRWWTLCLERGHYGREEGNSGMPDIFRFSSVKVCSLPVYNSTLPEEYKAGMLECCAIRNRPFVSVSGT